MKKVLVKGSLIVLGIVLLTGCNLTKNKEKEVVKDTSYEVTLNHQEIETMETVSNIVFEVEKDKLKETEFSEDKKSYLARSLVAGSPEEHTGKELLETYQNYFGKDKVIDFQDIKCTTMQHDSEAEQVIYHYDKGTDKYVYNEKHPGHGGGKSDFIGSYMVLDNIKVTDKEYIYEVKILFYGKASVGDVGGMSYGKGYGSYDNAINGNSVILDIDNSRQYWFESDIPYLNMNKLMEDYRDKLDTYEFHFEKEGDHLIFKSYNRQF